MKPSLQTLSTVSKREQLTAYYMLAPALLIVFTVAIYPLGSGFINSFTNATFASDRPSTFVGFRNYVNLVSIDVRFLRPLATSATGKHEYPSASEVFHRMEEFRISSASIIKLGRIGVPPAALTRLRAITGRSVRGPDAFNAEIERVLSPEFLPYVGKVLAAADRTAFRYSEIGQFTILSTRVLIGARDPDFLVAAANTIAFAIITVVFETIFGLGLALLINRKSPIQGVMRAVMLVPWAVPTAISSKIWEWMFSSTRIGFFNVIFQTFGLGNGQIPFLELPNAQLPIMCVIDIWKTTPFMVLLILAGLQLIPRELYEASDVDGIGPVKQFWYVTLPLLRQTIAVALVFRTLDALRVFDLFQIVLGESKYSLASFTYYQLIQSRAVGYSSASGIIIFLIVFAFAIFYTRALGINSDSELG